MTNAFTLKTTDSGLRLKTPDYICHMEVNNATVDKLAHLSRLQFNEAEKEEIKNDLQRMIAFVEKLNELDLEDVKPMLFMSDEVNVLREDEIKGSISREEARLNQSAPSQWLQRSAGGAAAEHTSFTRSS